MITEIEIEGFKSLEKVHLKLGGLNVFVGTNASGKSNFFDALRVFQGIGYGLSINEIFNGKPKGTANEVWEPIRGGSARVLFTGKTGFSGGLRLALKLKTSGLSDLAYSIWLSQQAVETEELSVAAEPIFEREMGTLALAQGPTEELEISGLEPRSPALSFLLKTSDLDDPQREIIKALLKTLGNMQRVDPTPSVLREYSQLGPIVRMGEHGENFAALVQSILESDELGRAYLSWLRQLTPMELDDVTVLKGALGEPLFALKESGQTMPASILSDGTLRFAALTAVFFQPDMPDILTIEEIENGIHPSRLRLLIELLKSQSGGDGPQVFATTHSPVVLAWLDESDYETTFLCKRDEETGASIIKPLSEIPRLVELVKKYSLGELLTEGWMESAF